jgi:hypothetical protein
VNGASVSCFYEDVGVKITLVVVKNYSCVIKITLVVVKNYSCVEKITLVVVKWFSGGVKRLSESVISLIVGQKSAQASYN